MRCYPPSLCHCTSAVPRLQRLSLMTIFTHSLTGSDKLTSSHERQMMCCFGTSNTCAVRVARLERVTVRSGLLWRYPSHTLSLRGFDRDHLDGISETVYESWTAMLARRHMFRYGLGDVLETSTKQKFCPYVLFSPDKNQVPAG